MKSIPTVAAFAAVSLIGAVTAQQPTENPSDGLTGLKTPKYLGCYSSKGSLVDMGDYTFQAMGWCQPLCIRQGKSVLAFTGGTNCLCGDSIPQGSDKIDDKNCQTQCAGYPQQQCGGNGAYMVFDDGYKPGDPTGTIKINAPSSTAAPIAMPTDQPDSQTHVQASTVFITQSGTSVPSVVSVTQVAETNSSPGPNKAAIAAGVVVAVVGLAAIIGGVVLFMRRKKQQALEEERRQHEDQTRLATGEKPPSTYSLADSRLEPSVMFQRRQSDGSIMDNQDYSRRILKVTNPDGR